MDPRLRGDDGTLGSHRGAGEVEGVEPDGEGAGAGEALALTRRSRGSELT
jgi:hypothetical protein